MTPTCSRPRCGGPGDAVHLGLDGSLLGYSCRAHDLGGYWIMLADLRRRPAAWRDHLHQKSWGGPAIAELVVAGLLEPAQASQARPTQPPGTLGPIERSA